MLSAPPLQLNAFDSRHLDEIYFDVRLTAFQDARRRIEDMQTLDMDYLSMIMHNCFDTFEVSRTHQTVMIDLLLVTRGQHKHCEQNTTYHQLEVSQTESLITLLFTPPPRPPLPLP